jgi:hypothetical protein
MTARIDSEPAALPSARTPADAGTVPMTFFRANMDRRNIMSVGYIDGIRGVTVAIEDDGALSKRFFDDDGASTSPLRRADLHPSTLHLAHALGARQAAAQGRGQAVEAFAAKVIGRRGARWEEAVSTALLGSWADPLRNGGRLDAEALKHLKTEAERLHRQLMPLWRRRTSGSRLLLLDTPLGDGLSLYDLVTGYPDTQSLVFESAPENARLAAVLRELGPDERAVALAWGHRGVATWADAALFAGIDDPVLFGEQVRRKVRRIAVRNRELAVAAPTTGCGAS